MIYRLTQDKRRTVNQFIKEHKETFYYGRRQRFKPIMIAESIEGRIRIYLDFIDFTPRILVMEKTKSGFFEEKRDHPYNRASPTNEVKKVLMGLGY